jgi:hypothetical protein
MRQSPESGDTSISGHMLPNRWTALAYASAIVLTAAIGFFLVRVPFQTSDTLNSLITLHRAPSATGLFVSTMNQPGFMRPASWMTAKLVFDASAGHEFLAFRAFHIVMVLGLLAGLVRLFGVATPAGCGLSLLAMATLIGMHPFNEAVRETDLNIKLLIPAIAVAALNLSYAERPALWRNGLVVLLSAYAILANELGLLVWVAVVSAYLVGFRGVSRGTIVVVTLMVAAYLGLRFTYLNVGAPGLTERSSGFGLRTLEPPELIARFGDHPLPFYAYNIAAAALSVLASEPRNGVFVFVGKLLAREADIGTTLNVITSVTTTGLLLWFAVRRWSAWRRLAFTHADRLYIVAALVFGANAAISYPYLKDVTMSTGAIFYPLAVFAAMALLLADTGGRTVSLGRAMALGVYLVVVSLGWTIRAASFAVDMRHSADAMQHDWRALYDSPEDQVTDIEPEDRPFVDRLRAQMLTMPVPRQEDEPSWLANLDPH